jgi:peptidoglycan/LPS O-acetylase OafA/YrhL
MSVRRDLSVERGASLEALNGFRALLILPVIAVHYGFWSGDYLVNVAVCGFFVLSGFLITRSLLARKDSGRTLAAFFAERMARIFPIYYLTLGAVWLMVHEPRIGWAFVYRYNEVGGDGSGPLGPMWSLAIEEQFYLFAPFLIWLLSARRASWVFGLVVAWAVYWMCQFSFNIDANLKTARLDPAELGAFGSFILAGLLPNMIPLGAGVLMGLNEEKLQAKEGDAWFQAPTAKLGLVVAAVGAGLVGLIRVVTTPDFQCLQVVAGQLERYVIAIVLFIVALHHAKARGFEPLKWLLENKQMAYIAKITYCLYIIHVPVLLAVYLSPLHGWRVGEVLMTAPIALVFTFVLAAASQRWFEGPILRFVKRKMSARPTLGK